MFDLIQRMKSFFRNEDGVGTAWALAWVILSFAVAGLSVDVTNAWKVKQFLQSTADFSAQAGALELGKTGNNRIKGRVAAAANAIAEMNMPNSRYGDVLIDRDIQVGTWDAATRTFVPMASGSNVAPDTVRVTTRQSGGASRTIGTFFLRFAGFDEFTVSTSATVQRFISPCSADGIISASTVKLSSQEQFSAGYCVHGEQGVDASAQNVFDTGAIVSMASLENCGPSSATCSDARNPGIEEALRQQSLPAPKVAKIDRYIAALQDRNSGLQPAYINPIRPVNHVTASSFDATTLQPGEIYVVTCTQGQTLNLGVPNGSGHGNNNGSSNSSSTAPGYLGSGSSNEGEGESNGNGNSSSESNGYPGGGEGSDSSHDSESGDGEGSDNEGSEGESSDSSSHDGESSDSSHDSESGDGEGSDNEGSEGESSDSSSHDGESSDSSHDSESGDGEGSDNEGSEGESSDSSSHDGESSDSSHDSESGDGEGSDDEGAEGESSGSNDGSGSSHDSESGDGEGSDDEGAEGESSDSNSANGDGSMVKSEFVLVAQGCDLHFDNTIQYQDAVFATTSTGRRSVSASAGAVLGRNDACEPGGEVTVITRGSVNFAAKLETHDAEFIVKDEVHIASKSEGGDSNSSSNESDGNDSSHNESDGGDSSHDGNDNGDSSHNGNDNGDSSHNGNDNGNNESSDSSHDNESGDGEGSDNEGSEGESSHDGESSDSSHDSESGDGEGSDNEGSEGESSDSKHNSESSFDGLKIEAGGKVQITSKYNFSGCSTTLASTFDPRWSYRVVE